MANEGRKEVAKILFLQGMTLKEIAAKIGVSVQSLTAWRKSGNWDTLKKNLLNSKNERLSELYDELAEFNKMIKEKVGYKVADSREADARRKLLTDIQALERKYNIGQTTTIARDFVLFARDVDFDFSQKALSYFDSFINHLIEKQKWQKE